MPARRSSSRSDRRLSHSRFKVGLLILLPLVIGLLGWWFIVRRGPRLAVPSLGGHDPALYRNANNCDVLVVGGTPAGVAAALAAARRGANVILVEPEAHLGGDIVDAMLNMFDVPLRPNQKPDVSGIFGGFYQQLGMAFDIARARTLFEDRVADEPNIRAYLNTRVARVLKNGPRVTGALLQTRLKHGAHKGEIVSWPLEARSVVDATNDASFAARAGAGYYIGRENANPDKRMQAAGLLFSVADVKWDRVQAYVRGRRLLSGQELVALKGHGNHIPIDVTPVAGKKRAGVVRLNAQTGRNSAQYWLHLGGSHGNYAWERGDVMKNYVPRGPNLMFVSINMGRQSDGSVVLNTLNIVGVNGLDTRSRRHAREEAVRELPLFLKYLRGRMPGFEHARLARVAPELYIRETRHIHGFYALKVADVRAGQRFFDRIAVGGYPLDLHPYVKGELNPFGPQRHRYTLPLRCLIPRRVDGVFVASRSLSATYSAAGSARVIPVTMAAGEAAGAASAMCAAQGFTPHAMMNDSRLVSHLQQDLRAHGLDIGDGLKPSPTPQGSTS